MKQLPILTPDQEWCCAHSRGPCQPVQSTFEYSREEYPNGDVTSKTTLIWVSSCCNAELLMYDNAENDFIGWKPVVYPEEERMTEIAKAIMEKQVFPDPTLTFHTAVQSVIPEWSKNYPYFVREVDWEYGGEGCPVPGQLVLERHFSEHDKAVKELYREGELPQDILLYAIVEYSDTLFGYVLATTNASGDGLTYSTHAFVVEKPEPTIVGVGAIKLIDLEK